MLVQIQQKLHFEFWVVIFSWANNMWYDTLYDAGQWQQDDFA